MGACDELYWSSAVDSGYEEFAVTCGGTSSGRLGTCDDEAQQAVTDIPAEDPALERLSQACLGGDMEACDDLFDLTDEGSTFYEIGASCGRTQPVTYPEYCNPAHEVEMQIN
ncbi:MAG: hypothetical protein Q4G64_07110 [bacterium]|nr:hypothetical protein [bacterium]